MARKQGFNRSTAKAAHRDNNKTKQTRSLKNKLRDVQRLLKKVRHFRTQSVTRVDLFLISFNTALVILCFYEF